MELKEIDKLYDVHLSFCESGNIDFNSSEVEKYMGFINKYKPSGISLIANEVYNIKKFYTIDEETSNKLKEAIRKIYYYGDAFSKILENFDGYIEEANKDLKKLSKKTEEEIKSGKYPDYTGLDETSQKLLEKKINHTEAPMDIQPYSFKQFWDEDLKYILVPRGATYGSNTTKTLLEENNTEFEQGEKKVNEEQLFSQYDDTVKKTLEMYYNFSAEERKTAYNNLISVKGASDTEVAKAIAKEFPEVLG